MTKAEKKNRRIALECASRVGIAAKGDVRQVLNNATLFEAWLNDNETEVAIELAERFDN